MVYKIVLIIFLASLFIYCLSVLIYIIGARVRENRNLSTKTQRVSVIVSLKNEENRVDKLVEYLVNQDYPKEYYEIIIIDNNSTDNTYNKLLSYQNKFPNLRVFTTRNINSNLRFKKQAIDLGIKNASGDIILSTDADCHIKEKWISTMVKYFNDDIGFVIGCSLLKHKNNLFTMLQSLDFMLLMNAARSVANLGIPWACNGHNIGFRKSLYEKIGGYSNIARLVGGDDSVFMNLLIKKTKTKAVFADDKHSWITSDTLTSLKDFLFQRIRWSTDANYMHKINPVFFTVILATFLSNLSFLIMPVFSSFIPYFIGGILLKFFLEFIHCYQSLKFFNEKGLVKVFPLWFILEIPYIVFMGILSFWGNSISWYRNRK